MINVSNMFKEELANDNRAYLEYVDITLANGRGLSLTNRELWQGGLTIDDAVSSDNSFDIGAAITNKCTVVINNIYGDFSDYDFTDARVVAYVGLELSDGRKERVRKGTYAVDEATYNGDIITLTCLDNMRKFDKSYTKSKRVYPATLGQIVLDACSQCDVVLQTYTFPHSDFKIDKKPESETTTFREVISWVAQIAGCFCRCDVYGRLELKWYDQDAIEIDYLDGGSFQPWSKGGSVSGGSFSPWSKGTLIDGGEFGDRDGIHHVHSIYSMNISVDDVVITGVKVLEKTELDKENAIATYLSGSEGYVVSIENNGLIQSGTGAQISNWLGEQLIGLRFRRGSIDHSSDPTMEAGDVGFLTDRHDNTYRILFSSTKFTTSGSQTTTCSAQNPARNSADRYSAETKNYVEYRKSIEKERTEIEKALENLKQTMDESPGLFTTVETLPDGGKIFYMHNKPKLEESDIVWKKTADAWGVSTDGGETYNAGMFANGDTIVRILKAVGINADWINAGEISADLVKSGVLDGVVIESTYYNDRIVPPRHEKVRIDKGRVYLRAEDVYYDGLYEDVGLIEPYYAKAGDSDGNFREHYIEGIRIACRSQYGIANGQQNKSNIMIGRVLLVRDYGDNLEERYASIDAKNFNVTARTAIDGDLVVYGTKNRAVRTKNYGERLHYCYEMPSPMFGDIGEAETDDTGECYIYLDDIFAETVTAEIEYQVFLQNEGAGDIWVDEKTPVYFKVKGTENLRFAWEIKERQRDYEYERLDGPEEQEERLIDYGAEYSEEIYRLLREREEVLYETA